MSRDQVRFPTLDSTSGPCEKAPHRECDLFDVRLKCEVSRTQQLDRRVWVIAAEGLGACQDKIWIVLSPYREQRRQRVSEVFLGRV